MKAVVLLIPALALLAADGREAIWGTWKTGDHTWELTPKDDGKVHVTYSENGRKQFDFVCNTVGQECTTKADGRDATFSMYFNGDKLVQWERAGKETVRRRFHAVENGAALEVEEAVMSPPGKPETVRLTRSDQAGVTTAKHQ